MAPGRFRSKTADLSEFIRGSSSKHSTEVRLTPTPAPPVPNTPETVTPTKPKRKLTFLGRRRKSGSVSPSPSSSSQKLGEPSGITGLPRDIPPPLPGISGRQTSEFTPSRSSDRISTSLPPSLPPPNVSPPAFGTFSQFSQSKPSAPDVTRTPDPGRSSGAQSIKSLRAQKSTSFENSGRKPVPISQSHSRGGRPVITVSPPRKVSEDTNPSAQRPVSSASSWRSPRSLRKPMILPFSHKKEEQEKTPRSPPMSPTAVMTPPLPSSMQFPLPPNLQSSQLPKSSQDTTRSRRETAGSVRSLTSPTSETFSEASRRSSRAQSQTSRESKDQGDQLSPTSTLRIVEEQPRPRTRLSISTAGHASLSRQTSQSTRSPAPATPGKLGFRRGSRSPSPAGTPPTAPLPSLPPEAHESPVTSPTRASIPPPSSYTPPSGSSSPLSSVPTIPSLPSMSSQRSPPSLRQQVLRPRANTIPAPASQMPSPTLSVIPEVGKLREPEKHKEAADLPTSEPISGPPRAVEETEKEKEKEIDNRDSGSVTGSTSTSPFPGYSTPPRRVTDSPLYGDVMSLRATHEEYVRSIRETHAVEKADLLRRIEQLERDARKREREIKGLRWLVMNATIGGANAIGTNARSAVSLSAAETQGRYRSGSKSSEFSQLSTASSGISNHRHDAASALSALYSPRTSTEEGLYDLQTTISDLIAPANDTLPSGEKDRASSEGSVSQGKASPTGTGEVARRLRRSNTVPDGVSLLPTISKPSSLRSARRTSSPVLPPSTPPHPMLSSRTTPLTSGAGLGIDLPSIPSTSSSNYRLSSTDTTLSTASTIPSLTSNVSTASSSGLSAIPESNNPPLESTLSEKERENREKEERRASRALKRLSASSSSTSSLASSAYSSNLKLGQAPSIGQILDESVETNMDQVLNKLRAFGGRGVR